MITSATSVNSDVPESNKNFLSFTNMNIDDFMLPSQENSTAPSCYQQMQSGSTTPQYVPSPAPSGTSTPGINSGNNIVTSYSPANYSTHSPRMSQSPLVTITNPSPQQSRPASANSSMGYEPVSPHQPTMPSPQVATQHRSSMSSVPSPSIVGPQDSPMTSPLAMHQISYNIPSVTSAQPLPMVVPQIPSPVNRVSSQIIGKPAVSAKRSPNVFMQSRAPVRPMSQEVHPATKLNQMPAVRGMHPMNAATIARMAPSKSPSYKIFELNRRLQERHPQNESTWWDCFVREFFDDDATLLVTLCQEDGSNNFNLNRALIPRFFKSFFDAGAIELFFNLRHTKEWMQNNSIMVDSEQCAMETLYFHPIYTKVISEGRLLLEFKPDDIMRIKSWHYTARGWQEQIPRTVLSVQAQQPNPRLMQQWSMNITRQGFPTTTLNLMRMCCILQPMQQLMTMQKSLKIDPRECLKKSLVNNWRGPEEPIIPVMPQDTGRPAPKQRKKRKNAAEKTGPTNARKKRSQEVVSLPPVIDQAKVMVVGEPSMMGGTLGNGDERHITRIENSQPTLATIGRNGSANAHTPWTMEYMLSSMPNYNGNHQGSNI